MGSKHVQNILLPLTQALLIGKEILCFGPVQGCSKAVDAEGFLGGRVLLGRSVLPFSITLQALLTALAGSDTWYRGAGEGKKALWQCCHWVSQKSEAGRHLWRL